MSRKILCSIFLLATLISCQNQKKEKESKKEEVLEKKELPSNAIKIVYNKHIYFPVEFASQKGYFAFDTAAKELYFDSIFYHKNHFNADRIVKGILPGVGLKSQNVEVILDPIHCTLEKNNFTSNTTPIINLKSILGDFADGIFGNKLFENSILEISYDKEYLKIHSVLDSINTTDYQKIKLKKVNGYYHLPLSIKINDLLFIEGEFLLDLGSRGSINFTSDTAKQYDFQSKIDKKTLFYSKYSGIGGYSSSYEFNAASLKIADFDFSKMVFKYSIDQSGALSKRKYLGILGNQIFDRFDMIIDNIHNHLYLKPNSNYKQPFISSSLGFSFINRTQTKGGWIVTGLYKDSKAEKAGLKIDDKIVKVNGTEINSIDFKQTNEFFQQQDFLELSVLRNDSISKKITFKP